MMKLVIELIHELQKLWRSYFLLRKPQDWGIGALVGLSLVLDTLRKLVKEDCECTPVDDILKSKNWQQCRGKNYGR